jgi:hypothetical protein
MQELKVLKAVLVYQGGIANVFAVERFAMNATDAKDRAARRIYQGDFHGAAMFATGLLVAGADVTTMACNMAGDIVNQTWTDDLDSQPFSDKFYRVEG